eukprot:365431-Chlamydomonas_euryale.AAC.25
MGGGQSTQDNHTRALTVPSFCGSLDVVANPEKVNGGGGWEGGILSDDQAESAACCRGAAEAAAVGAWPQPRMGGQPGTHRAGSKNPRAKVAAAAARRPLRRANALGGLVAVRRPGMEKWVADITPCQKSHYHKTNPNIVHSMFCQDLNTHRFCFGKNRSAT